MLKYIIDESKQHKKITIQLYFTRSIVQCMDGQKCCNYRAASLPKKEYKIVKLNVL